MKTLRRYQELGKDHLLSMPFGRPHALLADEQGTGKTVQAIEAAKLSNCRTAIILCPAIIKEQWRREIIDSGWAGDDEIQTVYGLDAEIDSRPVVIVNYDIIRDTSKEQPDGSKVHVPSKNRKNLHERKSHVLIMDEAHRLKTHTSAQTRAVLQAKHGIAHNAYYKWALSGSIVPNRPLELYPMLRALAPEVLGKYDTYQSYVQRYCGGAFLQGKGASNIDELTASLQPFMLRRELKDVWAELPDVIENLTWLDVPYQSHPEWAGDEFMYEGTIRRCVAEAKIPYIVAYLKERFASGAGKIVVFTYHRAVTEQVAKDMHAYHPLKIYGGISPNKREESLAKFQEDPRHQLILIQISSGGEGLDGLQHVASELVLAEPEWSPGREDQAIARLRRFGQQRPVILTKLYAKNSYEETIYWSNQNKRSVIEVILKPNGGTFVMSIESRLESIDNSLKAILALGQPISSAAVQAVATAASQIGASQANFAPPAPPAPSAPLAAPAAPVVASPPLPSVIAPPAAPPVMSAPVAPPAPPAPPVPTSVAAADPAKEAFHKVVLDSLKPLGKAGKTELDRLNTLFSIEKLSDLGAEHRDNFLAHVSHAVGQQQPASVA